MSRPLVTFHSQNITSLSPPWLHLPPHTRKRRADEVEKRRRNQMVELMIQLVEKTAEALLTLVLPVPLPNPAHPPTPPYHLNTAPNMHRPERHRHHALHQRARSRYLPKPQNLTVPGISINRAPGPRVVRRWRWRNLAMVAMVAMVAVVPTRVFEHWAGATPTGLALVLHVLT